MSSHDEDPNVMSDDEDVSDEEGVDDVSADEEDLARMEAEDDASEMTAEEFMARKDVTEIKAKKHAELDVLRISVKLAPNMSSDYSELIQELNECATFSKQREVLGRFCNVFPLLTPIWKAWINKEIDMGTDSTRIVELFESALRDFWSSDVCSDYLQWVMRPDSDFDFATSKEKFERILQIVGLRPDCGALFWLGYLDYVELVSSLPTDGAQGDTSGNKGVAEMTSLFARALKVPQKGLSDIWDRYVDYADQHDSVSISHEIKKSYELALKKYNEELSDLEANLVSSVNKEEAYAAYVDYELDNGDPSRIQLIFERSVEVLPFCSTLWYQYLRWLDTELKVHQVIIPAYDRGCKLCFQSCILWERSLLALERADFNCEGTKGVWEQAKQAVSSPAEGISLYLTYTAITRREIAKAGSDDLRPVEALFEEGLEYLKEGDRTGEFRKAFAFFLYAKLKKVDKARKVWNDILASGSGNRAHAWLDAIQTERAYGDCVHARKLFNRAVNSVSDNPKLVFDAFLQFEREEGSLHDLDAAIAKVNAQAKRMNLRALETKKPQKQQRETGKGAAKEAPKADRKPPPAESTNAVGRKDGKPVGQKAQLAEALQPSQKRVHDAVATGKTVDEGPTGEKKPRVDSDGFKVPLLPGTVRKTSAGAPSTSTNESPVVASKQSETSGEGEQEQLGDPTLTVFVSNLDFRWTEADLLPLFQNVNEIRLVMRGKSNKGYGYIDFLDEASARAAIANDHKVKLNNRPIYISAYKPHKKGEKADFKFGTGLEKTKLFVRNVHYACNEDELKEFFSKFANVKDVRIVEHKTGQRKGVAYVEFHSEQDAAKALIASNGAELRGRALQVAISNPPGPQRQQRPDGAPPAGNDIPTARTARGSRLDLVPRSLSSTPRGPPSSTRPAESANGAARHGGQQQNGNTSSENRSPATGLNNDSFRQFLR